MSLLPIGLIIASCFLHAGWNLLARRERQELVFFRRKLILGVPVSLAMIGVAHALGYSLPPWAWVCATGAGLIGGLYFRSLGLAYGSSDFTVVYPVARALPLLMVAALDLLRGRYPSALGWLAIVMVSAGCVLAPQRSYRDLTLRHYAGKAIVWILLTAAATVGYTMLDKMAAEVVQRGVVSAVIQCGVFHIFSAVSYLAAQAVFEGPRPYAEDRVGWRLPAAAAVLGPMTYALVLWAYQLTPQTAYLVAFRQFSIVIGVVAAFRLYKEPGLAVRVPATLAIVAGLVLLALWG